MHRFAQEDIQPGEEISICYYSSFFSLLWKLYVPCTMNPEWKLGQEFDYVKNQIISTDWNTCPSDCSCQDPVIRELVPEVR